MTDLDAAHAHAYRMEWRDVSERPDILALPKESTLAASTHEWADADEFSKRDRIMKRAARVPLAHRIMGMDPLPKCEGLRWVGERDAIYVVVIGGDDG